MKRLLLSLILISSTLLSWSQELTVKSCEENITDLSASTNIRNDAAGKPCALVKVQILAKGVRFNGVIVGDVEDKGNEYWVYMRSGAARLSVQIPSLPALDVMFEDYGISSLASKTTYTVKVEVPEKQLVEMSDSLQYLMFHVVPEDATIVLDGDTLETVDGVVQKKVKIGQHNYRITRKFYCTETGQINVEKKEARVKRMAMFASNMTLKIFGTEIKLIPVNYDCFAGGRKGPSDEDELHSFLMAETEVTQKLWKYVMSGLPGMKAGHNPSQNGGNNNPVDNVNYEECLEFINRLNDYSGYHFRLPTEAEWEYAAKAGQMKYDHAYSGGDNLDDVAWYAENSKGKSHPVGTKKANEIGLFDMTGNVEEWCESEDGPVTKGGNYTSGKDDFKWDKRGSSVRSKVAGFRLAL